jgi:hypothetical protein
LVRRICPAIKELVASDVFVSVHLER